MSNDNNKGYVWYRDRALWYTAGAMVALGLVFSVGTTVVDGGPFNPTALLSFVALAGFTVLCAWVFRNNP